MVLIVIVVWGIHIIEDVNTLQRLVNHLGIKAEAVLVPEWFNGVVCKTIIHRFESDPALKYGDVVQLGERLPCTEEVAGSSPVSSTKY